ncbi:MAG: hypothetical protein ABIJ96_06185 [Elusimicrobiota bacterium]
MRRAKVWHEVDVASMDLLNGPQGEGSYKFEEKVPCKYEEKDPRNPLGGHSPKFPCWDKEGNRLKVKYNNTEVYGEVAATRLFWALGFYSERMYAVQIVCENCPEDPWKDDGTQKRAVRTFKSATVQKRLPGEEISENQGEGWSYDDLDLIDDRRGGSVRAEVDALKLLSVFVNHADNTLNQQRILCPPGDEKCLKPIAYVTDLGGTFGGKSGATDYSNWAKKMSLWKDKGQCVASFKGTSGSYRDPKISEAGRKHLADLLGALSTQQIKDLFRGARFDAASRHERIPGADGKVRGVTIDDWVRVFTAKRAEILSARCPE